MKKISFIVSCLLSLPGFAQDTREGDLALIKTLVREEYKGGNFDALEKWIVYGLKEENTSTHATHKPAMVYLLNGDEVLGHYYMTYDDVLKQYAYCSYNCCHLDHEGGELIAHCDDECTTRPFTRRSELEAYKAEMNDLVIYK